MTRPIKIIKKEDYEKEFGKPIQEEVWDSIASPWRTYVVKKLPIVEEFLKDKKGLVIDLGCGNGRNMIVSDELEYYGVDFSSGQLKHAADAIKKEGINAHLFKSSADDLDKDIFKSEMLDYGLFMATLHCLDSKEKRLNSLKEFFRVLKPGAEGLISVWDSTDKRFKEVGNKGDIYMSWEEDRKPYMRYYYLYSLEEIIKLLESVGFKILEIYNSREHDRFSKKNLIIRIKK
jgi:ubiquinone/menaquinone biosynthesis C-methylase UbiE